MNDMALSSPDWRQLSAQSVGIAQPTQLFLTFCRDAERFHQSALPASCLSLWWPKRSEGVILQSR